MQHQSFQILEEGEIRNGGDCVAGQVQVLQVHVLLEVLDALHAVIRETQPR